MSEYPRIERDDNPPRAGEYSIIWLSPDKSFKISNCELADLYTALAGFFAGIELNATAWGGFTTYDYNGTEIIHGWYGSFSTADHVARKLVASGKTKGARAYACIGEYGAYVQERPPVADLDGDDDGATLERTPEPETLDRWLL